jgi:hypothetical protein
MIGLVLIGALIFGAYSTVLNNQTLQPTPVLPSATLTPLTQRTTTPVEPTFVPTTSATTAP